MTKKANVTLDVKRFKDISGLWFNIPPVLCDDHVFSSSHLKENFYYDLFVVRYDGSILHKTIQFIDYRKSDEEDGHQERLLIPDAYFLDLETEKNLRIDLVALGLESYKEQYTLGCYLKLSPIY